MIFEDKLSEIQKDMISLALELAEDKIDTVYIYGSYENNSLFFNSFFAQDNKVYTINKLDQLGIENLTTDRMFQYLDIGITDFKRFITLFQEDKKQAPTQLKLVYDNVNKKAKAQYSYDLFYSNSDTLTSYDIFMEWYKEIKNERNTNKKGDMLEIYEANGKYILKYPTFNITMPEVVKEIPKEAVDSYLAGEHDGEELINYANFGFWKSKISQEDANIQFLRDNPEFLLIDTDRKRHYFSEKEFEELLKKAHEVSDADDK